MINLDKFNYLYGPNGYVRKHVLQRIEHLRENKFIGKSLEAGVKITYEGRDWRMAFWDGGTIQESLNVSWVELHWDQHDTSINDEVICGITVWNLKRDPEFVQCPRCFLFHKNKSHYDSLCFRCGGIMFTHFPNHPTLSISNESNC